MFGAICAASVVWVALFVPETRGVPLEHMDALFDKSALAVSPAISTHELPADERTPLLIALPTAVPVRSRRFSHSHAV